MSARASSALVLLIALAACASSARDREPSPTECASCHMPEYEHARDPVHVNAKPTACGICHSQESFRPSVIHHEQWPLVGAHEKAECAYCHKGAPPVYRGTPRECIGCHREDYEANTFPGHSRFATTCADCHATAAWKPAKRPAKPAPPALPESIDAGPPARAQTPIPPKKPAPKPVPTGAPTSIPTHITPIPSASSPPPDITSRPSPRRR